MLTIALPPDLEARVKGEASRQGSAAEDYVRRLIAGLIFPFCGRPLFSQICLANGKPQDASNDHATKLTGGTGKSRNSREGDEPKSRGDGRHRIAKAVSMKFVVLLRIVQRCASRSGRSPFQTLQPGLQSKLMPQGPRSGSRLPTMAGWSEEFVGQSHGLGNC